MAHGVLLPDGHAFAGLFAYITSRPLELAVSDSDLGNAVRSHPALFQEVTHPGEIHQSRGVIIAVYFLLYLIVWGVGVAHTTSPLIDQNRTIQLFLNVEYCTVALYAIQRITSERQRRQLFAILTFGITVSAVMAIFEHWTTIDLRLMFEPPGFTSVGVNRGISAAVIDKDFYDIRYGVKRSWGTSSHPIEFSVLVAGFLPIALHFARFSESSVARRLATLSTVILLFALPTGVSRSGMVALAAAFLVYAWSFSFRQWVGGLVLIAAIVGVQAMIAPDTMQALWKAITIQDESVTVRITRSTAIVESFRSSPIFGIGPAEVPKSLQLHGLNGLVTSGAVDNEWFGTLASGGIIGITGLTVLMGGGIFGISAARRAATSRRDKDLALAAGGLVVALVATSSTFDMLGFGQATWTYFLAFGALWSAYSIPDRTSSEPLNRSRPPAAPVVRVPSTAADG